MKVRWTLRKRFGSAPFVVTSMKNKLEHCDSQLELAIRLTKNALEVCDTEGFMLAAIDLCAAAEKLETLQNNIKLDRTVRSL